MRTVFLVLFLFFAQSKIGEAQRVFQKNFGSGNTTYGPYGMTSTPSCVNIFYSIGDCFDPWNNAQCFGIGLLTFDSLDNPASNYYYHDASDDTVHAAQYASNIGKGKCLVVGLCRDMNYNHQVSLYMFDSLNNFMKGRALDYGGDACRFEIVKPAPSLKSYYAFGLLDSSYASNFEEKIIFCRFDSLLNPLVSRTIAIDYSPRMKDFVFASDGNIVGCGSSIDTSIKSSILILKLDTTGNVIWKKKYSALKTAYAGSIYNQGDNFYIIGTLNDSDYVNAPEFLMKLDSVGNVIWCKKYYGPIGSNVKSIRTSDLGFLISSLYNYHGVSVSSLTKIDSTGNFQWGNGYAFGESNNFQCERPDKGFYTYGRTRFMDSTYTYILKTDSLGSTGCLEEPFTLSASTNCMFWLDTFSITLSDYMPPSFPIQLIRDTFQSNEITYCDGLSDVKDKITKLNKMVIYPNPVMEELKVIIEVADDQPAVLQIYDMFGEIIYENTLHLNPGRYDLVIPLYKMADGLYFLHVEQNDIHSSGKFLKVTYR